MSSSAPKVLLITRNFPPLRGGMERLNQRMFQSLHSHNPGSALVGPPGCSQFVPERARVTEMTDGPLALTLASGMIRGLAMARRVRPDVVLGGSGLAAPSVLAAAAAGAATPAVYLHGLDIVAPSRVYQHVWLRCIRRCHRVLVNSSNTRRLAIEAGVEEARIRIVRPGTDLPEDDTFSRRRFRSRHRIEDSAPVLLSVGRITARKGLAEFVENCLPRLRAAIPAVRLLIIGDDAPDAIHRGRGGGVERVLATAKKHSVGDAVDWLGVCSDEDLADAYRAADVLVFPVQEIPGDVEGFGMVAIEAAAHGLPTVAFDVGGISDAVSTGKNGSLVAATDYEGFARAVEARLVEDRCDAAVRARNFALGYSWQRFDEELCRVLAQNG